MDASTPPANADETREQLLDELARVYARAAVDAFLAEQQTDAEKPTEREP